MKNILLAAAILFCTSSYSQNINKEVSTKSISLSTAVNQPGTEFKVDFPVKSLAAQNDFAIKSAFTVVQLDMLKNGDYILGKKGDGKDFDYEFTFSLKAFKATDEEVSLPSGTNYKVKINNNEPLTNLKVDLLKLVSSEVLKEISYIKIVNPQFNALEGAALINENLQCILSVDVEYRFGVTIGGIPIERLSINAVELSGSTARFSWGCAYPFTHYQIQLLKLTNTVTGDEYLNQNLIQANVDWKDAIILDITNSNVLDYNNNIVKGHYFETTLSQGTGYYAWRVRPVGNLYDGGLSNIGNLGFWSDDFFGTKKLGDQPLEKMYFFYADPDDAKNKIYNRVFTEESKIKEVTTFANGLNQVEQTKTYLPSKDVTVVSQTVTDYSGRSAITSLPTPVLSKNINYSDKILTTQSGEVYTAKSFDGNNKLTEQTDEQRELSYFLENPDPRIPNSDGYPFSQTTYYDDPLNRVKQQGGPGQMFRVKTDGSEKNTKYFYGTPSKTELVRLFGSEAPSNETVSKTVQVDPNNVATITYTSLEGKVLASGLSFLDNENSILENLTPDNNRFQVTDELTKNIALDSYILSTKRIVLMQSTLFNVKYKLKYDALQLCSKKPMGCNFKVTITIKNIDDGTVTTVLKDAAVDQFPTVDGYLFIDPQNPMTLKRGSYVVEKRLTFGTPTPQSNDEVKRDGLSHVEPITNLIISRLDDIRCAEKVADFQRWLKDFSIAILNKDQFPGSDVVKTSKGILTPEMSEYLSSTYVFDMERGGVFVRRFTFKSGTIAEITDPADITPADYVVIETPCCTIPFNVQWGGLISDNVVPKITVSGDNITFIPDFETYANNYLADHSKLRNWQFYKYMAGWDRFVTDWSKPTEIAGQDSEGKSIMVPVAGPRNTFNLMIYHMLTDDMKDYVKNPYLEKEKENGGIISIKKNDTKVDGCGNVESEGWGNKIYTPSKLLECWKNQLDNLKSSIRGGFDIADIQNLQNIDFKGQTENNPSNQGVTTGSIINKVSREVPWLLRRIVKRRLKRKLNSYLEKKKRSLVNSSTDEPFEVNIVKDFLGCTGYSFVKILTAYDPEPLQADKANTEYNIEDPHKPDFEKDPNIKEYVPIHPFLYNIKGVSSESYFSPTSFFKKTGTFDYYYFSLSDWEPKTSTDEVLFPRIKNPIYAFKYFEYPEEGTPDFQGMELKTCYSDPNDCYKTSTTESRNIDGINYFFLEQGTGGFNCIPCCLNGINDIEKKGCLNDANYPNLEDIFKTGDPRFEFSEGKKTKLIVKEFEGNAQAKCAYDHKSWSSGQRLTFYNNLSKFDANNEVKVEPTDDPELRVNSCLSFETNMIKLYTDNGRLLTEDDCVESGCNYTEGYKGISQLNQIQLEMYYLLGDCKQTCYDRRDKIKEQVTKMFIDNCYEIGGCIGPKPTGGEQDKYENIVQIEDIDKIVSKLVGDCASQCKLNTYGCKESYSRRFDTPKAQLGVSSVQSADIFVGIAGTETFDENYNMHFKTFDGEGLVDDIYKFPLNNGIDVNSYSWAQYTGIKQALEWSLEMNVPSKCESYTLQAEGATSVKGIAVTSENVEYSGTATNEICFNGLDFGYGTKSIDLKYSYINPSANLKILLKLRNDDNTEQVIGQIIPVNATSGGEYVTEAFTLNEALIGSGLTGIKNLVISFEGGQEVSVDWIKLAGAPGVYSNIREFKGVEDGSMGVRKDLYERPAQEIIDANLPGGNGKPVVSPSKLIKYEVKR